MEHTAEQAAVIAAACQNILISAAAGSGKTAVMTDRIVRRVVSGELDMQQVLVVTFTEAAARNMREKIEGKLRNALADEQDARNRQRISRQIAWLPGAAISTIHAFCLSVIRDFYDQARDPEGNPLIEPGFSVDDGVESDLLLRQTLDEWMNSRYEAIDQALEREAAGGDNPDAPAIATFYRLFEGYGDSRGDQPVRDLIINLHRFLRSLPDYTLFVADRLDELAAAADDFAASRHCQALLRQLRLRLDRALTRTDEIKSLLATGVRFVADPGKNQQFLRQFDQVLTGLEQLDAYLAAGFHDWDEIRQMGQSFAGLNMPRGSSKDSTEKTAFLSLFRESAGEVIHFLSGACGTEQFRRHFIFETRWMFSLSASEIEEQITAMLPAIRLLFESVLELDRLYTGQKRTAGLIDFSDFEHLALAILRHDEVRQYYNQKFREIYIDEYQDTSSIQDAILGTVSAGNCLMVGDIKQSIYRFRHARPAIFRSKAAAYRDRDGGVLFELNRNFRSVAGILDAANDLFAQLMSTGAGEIEYDEHQILTPHRPQDPAVDIPVEVVILDRSEPLSDRQADEDEDAAGAVEADAGNARPGLSGTGSHLGDPAGDEESLEEMNRNQQEARLAIPRIRDLVRSGLHYRDLVVLTRTRAVGLVWREVLEKEDLPIVSDAGSGFLDTPAMRLAESLIHILDNQRQDIPLAAVMHAGIHGEGFSLDDLAAIRLFGKQILPDNPYFHLAVFSYRHTGPDESLRQRVSDFLDWMDQLRHREQTLRLSELVDLAMLDTGWLDRVAAGPDGPAEVRRLRQFRLWTEQFEKNRRQGLYRFARHLESLRRRGPLESPISVAETDQDAIRIMTIHGSKGLEFPVVILAGTGFSIRSKDAQDHVLISEGLGIGMDYADPERQVRYPSLLKQAMLDEIRATGMAEELRLLYVAMTRAMDRLIIVGSVKPGSATGQNRLQNLLTQARACSGQRLPDYLVLSARSYLEWIFLALARKPELTEIVDRLAVADTDPTDLTQQIYPWSLSCRTLASLSETSHRGKDLDADSRDEDSLGADSSPLPPDLPTIMIGETPCPDQAVDGETQQSPASLQPETPADLMTVEAWLRMRSSLEQRITQPYRLEQAARTPIKLSVSELKRRELGLSDPEWRDGEAIMSTDFAYTNNPSGIDLDLRPMLHEDAADLDVEPTKGSRLGTLLHTVFRYIDLASARSNPNPNEVDRQLTQMVDLGMISPDDLAVAQAYRQQILAFVQSTLAQEIVAAMTTPDGQAFVEMPFTLALPACQVYSPCDGLDPDDRVLVQGIIDCWYRLDDRITLVDYKTDRIQGDEDTCSRELQRRYSRQLAYYAQAIEAAAGQPVTRRIIWHIGRACLFEMPS